VHVVHPRALREELLDHLRVPEGGLHGERRMPVTIARVHVRALREQDGRDLRAPVPIFGSAPRSSSARTSASSPAPAAASRRSFGAAPLSTLAGCAPEAASLPVFGLALQAPDRSAATATIGATIPRGG